MASPSTPLAIIGGGVAGLAMAVALQKAGIACSVFERDPSFDRKRQGYGMTLQAQTALDELGILDAIRAADTPSKEHWTFDAEGFATSYFGNAFVPTPPDESGRQRGNLRVPRETLRRILHSKLAPGTVSWGHTLEGIEEREGGGGVTLHFSRAAPASDAPAIDSSTTSGSTPDLVSVSAAGVIGADGIHSRVRRVLAGGASQLSYLGVVLMLGTSAHTHALLDRRGFYTLDGTHRLFTMPFADSEAQAEADAAANAASAASAPLPSGDEHSSSAGGGTSLTMWQLTFRVESVEEARRIASQSPEDLVKEAQRRIGHWHAPVPLLLAGSLPGHTWSTPLYDFGEREGEVSLPPGKGGRKGGNPSGTASTGGTSSGGTEVSPAVARYVTLIGDAAHPMSPFKGQGCNQALRDAVGLAAWIARASSIPPAFSSHEREMAQRAGRKVLDSRAAATFLHSPAALDAPAPFAGVPDVDAPTVLAAARAAGITAADGAAIVPRFRQLIVDLRAAGTIAAAPASTAVERWTARRLMERREDPPASSASASAIGPTATLTDPGAFSGTGSGTGSEDTVSERWTLLYYCYADLSAPGVREGIAEWLRSHATHVGLVGRIRVAFDGLNASVGLSRPALEAHCAALRAHPVFGRHVIDFKFAPSAGPRSAGGTAGCAFDRFEAKLCSEVVTLNLPPGVARPENAAPCLTPQQFHAAMWTGRPDGQLALGEGEGDAGTRENSSGEPDAVLIDVRNKYETDIGTFRPRSDRVKLIVPNTRTFDQMPQWFDDHAEELKGKAIFMCCTGGVRCVRTSAYLKEKGFDRVFHLQGGMQRYMEAAEAGALSGPPGARDAPPPSLWAGKLFVFDERDPVKLAAHLESSSPSGANDNGWDGDDDQDAGAVDGSSSASSSPAAASSSPCPSAVAGTVPHIQEVLGRCTLCTAPWERYNWLRCRACRVLVLVCDECTASRGGEEAVRPSLQCGDCAAGRTDHAIAAPHLRHAHSGTGSANHSAPSPQAVAEARAAQRLARGEARRVAAEASGEADARRDERRSKKAAARAAEALAAAAAFASVATT